MRPMKDNYPIQTQCFRNIDEARKCLYDRYQDRYEILNKREILTGGFMGFGQKERLEISFRIKDVPQSYSRYPVQDQPFSSASESEESSFARQKAEILKTLSANSVQPAISSQISELSRQLQELNRKIDEKPVSSGNSLRKGAGNSGPYPFYPKFRCHFCQQFFTGRNQSNAASADHVGQCRCGHSGSGPDWQLYHYQ